MKRLVAAIIALFLLAGCVRGKYQLGQVVQTKVDHRTGQITECELGGFYCVRFSVNEHGYYSDFELEAKE